MNKFLHDVLKGLQSSPKYLDSKYFYDQKGDVLFQQIMASDEYYLTRCEMEIFSQQTKGIANAIMFGKDQLDVIEFGVGDATKSSYLLEELLKRDAISTYFPIDISGHIIELLNEILPKQLPGIPIHGLTGEYFEMLFEAKIKSNKKKLILLLGANIGNFKFNEMPEFCKKLHGSLSESDLVLIGFDLKKDPKKILAAYNDREGFTSEFNLNLLARINNELNGNFNLKNFEHYATYDPDSGACKSYLVSKVKQVVSLGENKIYFEKDETIFMEISQKYSVSQIDEIAVKCGFTPLTHFFDADKSFVDVIWKVN